MTTASLLARLGRTDRAAWERQWQQRLERRPGVDCPQAPLLWGFALPLLTALEIDCGRSAQARPVIALQAPVGAGKSTLARQLQALASSFGCRLAVASIDDAYLEWPQRQRLLAGNPFGVNRVPPGSHDTALLQRLIADWRQGGELRLPRFDKSLRQGQGDRCGWTLQRPQALLLEGWLVGYEPRAEVTVQHWLQAAGHDLSAEERAWLPRWNRALQAYQPLWGLCSSLWVLRPSNWNQVLRWRLQAEARQRRQGGQAMAADAVRRLVRATLASLPPGLYEQPLLERAMGVAVLDAQRRCLQVTPGL